MMRRTTSLLLLVALWGAACGASRTGDEGLPEADVRVELESRKVEQGEPIRVVIRTQTGPETSIDVGAPQAEGLTVRLEAEKPETLGTHTLVSRTWALEGPPGSYVVQTGDATVHHADGKDETVETPPLFVDIGVKGPSSDLADIVSLNPTARHWGPWIAAGTLLAAAILGGLAFYLWKRRRRKPAPEVIEPPDVVALRAWAAVRDDPRLDDHTRALRMSEIFRAYLEGVHEIPATSWTTREILASLLDSRPVAPPLVTAARRLLDATDLLKFARRGGGAEFFQSLDKDFQDYVAATRPRPLDTVAAVERDTSAGGRS